MSVFDLQQIIESTPVKEIDFHETLASTNDRALESIKNGQLEFPMLVLTDQQIAGRGQGNRKWLASPGSLTFSLCLTHPTTGTSAPLPIAIAVDNRIGGMSDHRKSDKSETGATEMAK